MQRRYVLALGLAAWPFLEPQLPVLRRTAVHVLPPGVRPLTVLHLSDLHLLPRHTRRAAWVRGLARHRPDLVVSTGDHLSDPAAIGLLAATLGSFDAPGFFVPGNNDYFMPSVPLPWRYLRDRPLQRRSQDMPWKQAISALAAVGWTDLTHRRATPLPGVTLTGTDDGHLGRDRYVPAPVQGLGIGVTHTPANRLLTSYAGDGHALVLAGHTHGGQVRVPLLGPIKRASLYGTQFLEGWVEAAAAQPNAAEHSHPVSPPRVNRGYVTHGLGVTGLPFRLGVPAEMTVFEFGVEEGV